MSKPRTKFKINYQGLAQLKRMIIQSFEETIKELDMEFQAVISDTNAFADIGVFNQDIIWSGRLKESQQLELSTEGNKVKASWQWDPVDPETGDHYAGDVFVGFTTWSGRFIPGRNWPDKGIERYDPFDNFVVKLRAKLR